MTKNRLNKAVKDTYNRNKPLAINGRRFIYYGSFKKHLSKVLDEVFKGIHSNHQDSLGGTNLPTNKDSKHKEIKVRKLDPVKGTTEKFNPKQNTLRKDDFKAFVPVLKDSLQDYLSQTPHREITLLGLKSLVENALNKADAHEAIRDRVSYKVEENSSSKASILQYLYNFILQHEAVGAIYQNIKVK